MLTRMWRNWSPRILLKECKTVQPSWGKGLVISQKVKQSIWLRNSCPSYIPKELKAYVHTEAGTKKMFIEALFIIVKKETT